MRLFVIFSAVLAITVALPRPEGEEVQRGLTQVIDLSDTNLSSGGGRTSSSSTSVKSSSGRISASASYRKSSGSSSQRTAVNSFASVSRPAAQPVRRVQAQAAPRPAAPRPAAPRQAPRPVQQQAPRPAAPRFSAPAPQAAPRSNPSPQTYTQHEVKTLVVVLQKKQNGVFSEPPAPIINKPEVFYVKYDSEDDTETVVAKVKSRLKLD